MWEVCNEHNGYSQTMWLTALFVFFLEINKYQKSHETKASYLYRYIQVPGKAELYNFLLLYLHVSLVITADPLSAPLPLTRHICSACNSKCTRIIPIMNVFMQGISGRYWRLWMKWGTNIPSWMWGFRKLERIAQVTKCALAGSREARDVGRELSNYFGSKQVREEGLWAEEAIGINNDQRKQEN